MTKILLLLLRYSETTLINNKSIIQESDLEKPWYVRF